MSQEIEEIRTSAPLRRLSGGDAVAIIALLVFILAWVGGWIWGITVTTDIAYWQNAKWTTSLFMLLIVCGPAIWASNIIKHIVGKDD